MVAYLCLLSHTTTTKLLLIKAHSKQNISNDRSQINKQFRSLRREKHVEIESENCDALELSKSIDQSTR